MKKYKYQCDNSSCSKKFIASNPSNCPSCTSDDFTLIGEPNKLWLWITILVVLILLLFRACCYTPPPSEINYTIEEVDNYIQINTPKGYDFDNADFVLTDQTNNKELYNDGNKFYPCDGSGVPIIIKFSDLLLRGEDKIENYRFPPGIIAKKEFCEEISDESPQFLGRGVERDCPDGGIKVHVSDDSEVEYSIDNTNFFKGKDKWSKEEVGDAKRVYVRYVGQTEVNKKRIKKCKKEEEDNYKSCQKKNELENLLSDYLKDKNKRKPLTDWIKANNAGKVTYYIGSENIGRINSFISRVNAENLGGVSVDKWSVKEISCSGNSIVKVKIKK